MLMSLLLKQGNRNVIEIKALKLLSHDRSIGSYMLMSLLLKQGNGNVIEIKSAEALVSSEIMFYKILRARIRGLLNSVAVCIILMSCL